MLWCYLKNMLAKNQSRIVQTPQGQKENTGASVRRFSLAIVKTNIFLAQ